MADTGRLGTVKDAAGAKVFQQFTPDARHGSRSASVLQDFDVVLALDHNPYTRLHTSQSRPAGAPYSLSIVNATPLAVSVAFFAVTVVNPGELTLTLQGKAAANGVTVTGASDIVRPAAAGPGGVGVRAGDGRFPLADYRAREVRPAATFGDACERSGRRSIGTRRRRRRRRPRTRWSKLREPGVHGLGGALRVACTMHPRMTQEGGIAMRTLSHTQDDPARAVHVSRTAREARAARHASRAGTTFARFIRNLAAVGDYTIPEAERRAIAVIATLEERIPIREVLDLEAQLPSRLDELLAFVPLNGLPSMDRIQFCERVAARARVSFGHAEEIAATVFAFVRSQISVGEAKHVASQLPDDLRELWSGKTP